MSRVIRSLGSAFAFVWLAGCSSCSCGVDDDDTTGPPDEDCDEKLDLDGDGLMGCEDPDCWSDPHCQVPWASTVDAFLGAARFVPGDDDYTNSFYTSSLAGPWTDLDGDGHLDTVVTVACLHSSMFCIDDIPVHFAQYVVQAEDLLGQSIAAYEPDEALAWQPLTEDDLLQSNYLCRGSTTLLDLDGDGFQDLVVAQPNVESGPALRLWWGAAEGMGMPRPADLEVPGEDRCTYAFAAGDVIGDDNEDLVVWGGPLPESGIGLLPGGVRYASLSSADFPAGIQTSAAYGDTVTAVERAGDLTGDGRDDLLVVAHCGAIFSNQHPCETPTQFLLAVFAGKQSWPGVLSLADLDAGRLIETETMPWSVIGLTDTGDLDGDGLVDVVFAFSEVTHETAIGSGLGKGVGYIFPGSQDGWSGVGPGAPVHLLPSVFTSDFGETVQVGDVDGDGFDDIVIGNEGEGVPSYISEASGLDPEQSNPLGVIFFVYSGQAIRDAAEGERLLPDRLVIDGYQYLPGYEGAAPSAVLFFASMHLDADLDTDGVNDWIVQSSGYVHDIPDPAYDRRTVVEVFSGAKLLETPE